MRLDFDVDKFLRLPLVARVATAGPSVRPVWFLWEDDALWWLTGPWSTLAEQLERDPTVAVVIDTCDLVSGEVKQVRVHGEARVVAYERDRAFRKLSRYLGPDETAWDASRFDLGGHQTRFVRLEPNRIEALELSFEPSAQSQVGKTR